ncbi:hypothetical protein KKF92_02660 [Patescibacteria group bacterium]|nr:hypothetical protein [Patescibacteria group bacterium]
MKIKLTKWQKFSFWLILATIIGLVFKSLTPQSTPESNPQLASVGGVQTQVKQLSYQGLEPTIPEKLSAGQATLIKTDGLLAMLLDKFSLSVNLDSPNLWVGDEYSLFFDKVQSIYGLSLNLPQPVSAQLNSAELSSQAEQLVSQLLPQTNLVIDQTKTRYLTGQYQQKEVAESLAEYMELSFFQKFQDFPVYNQASLRPSVLVLMDANGQITKLEVSTQLFTIAPPSDQTPISLDRAQANIEQGNASLLDLETNSLQTIDRSKFASGQLYEVQIEYRVDKQLLVKPFYRFSGNLVTTGGQTVQAEIITPSTLDSP